jgi:hypothetical protein
MSYFKVCKSTPDTYLLLSNVVINIIIVVFEAESH